jgi:hypothetical protein
MAWVVVSNLLLDIALDDPRFRPASMELLRKRRSRGLVASPVTIVELAPSFDGDAAAIREFLDAPGGEGRESWSDDDTVAACGAWARHIAHGRAHAALKRPVADVLIGAFAERFDGLLTRNSSDFRALFANLRIDSPSSEVRSSDRAAMGPPHRLNSLRGD